MYEDRPSMVPPNIRTDSKTQGEEGEEEMREYNGRYLHNCPNIDDNFGPQVVFKGGKCPFCGEAATESTEPPNEVEADQ